MKTDEENKAMNIFDKRVSEVFRGDLPEMPELPDERVEEPEILELSREDLDQLQAAGETVPPEIIRLLKNKRRTDGLV